MTPALLSLPWSCTTSLDLPARDHCLTRPQLLTHASSSSGGGHPRSRPVAVPFMSPAGEMSRRNVGNGEAHTRMTRKGSDPIGT